MMRLQGFMPNGYTFISKSNAEFFQQKFTLSRAVGADANH